MKDVWHDPDYWRQRGEEAQAIVKHLGEPYAKLQMIMIAQAYSHLARHAQERAVAKSADVSVNGATAD
jgi:hypothetical protein